MKRLATALGLALAVTGCGAREPVQLLTGVPAQLGGEQGWTDGTRGCFTFGITGTLVSDPTYGTAFVLDKGWTDPFTTVVAWPPDYTGQRVGSEVEVHDGHGTLVAITGRHYANLPGGFSSIDDVAVFWSCDTPS